MDLYYPKGLLFSFFEVFIKYLRMVLYGCVFIKKTKYRIAKLGWCNNNYDYHHFQCFKI